MAVKCADFDFFVEDVVKNYDIVQNMSKTIPYLIPRGSTLARAEGL
jgi:hypothetical protein